MTCSDADNGSFAGNVSAGSYYYPQGRGHPVWFGQPRFQFGGEACNLSLMLSWKWSHPQGRYAAVTTGKPVVDDRLCIYFAQEDAIRKFSPSGALFWTWHAVSNFPGHKHVIPNHPVLFEGHIYDCLTSGHIFALDMIEGHLVWSTRVGSRHIGQQGDFMTVHNGRLFVALGTPEDNPNIHIDRNYIAALNATSGEVLWEYESHPVVWNFLPHFLGADKMLAMGVDGGARCINVTSGEEIWRAPHGFHFVPWYQGWTDGGPALGPNGKFYTVSSFSPHVAAHRSVGGGLHAFDVDKQQLAWEVTDFRQGIYTYPAVGYTHVDNGQQGQLIVITGVGSLASVPYMFMVAKAAPFAFSRGALLGCVLWVLRFSCWRVGRSGKPRLHVISCLRWLLLGGLVCATMFCLVIACWALKNYYDYSIQAFEAESGARLWTVELPRWTDFAAAGDSAGFLTRWWQGTREACLPGASSYGVIDSQGVFWMGHLDGHLWRVKDWNQNGVIEPGTHELCSTDLGAAFPTGGVTIVPGMLIAATCDTLYVFKE